MEEEPQNGNTTSAAAAESEEEPIVGPGPAPRARTKRPLQFEQAYLDALPSAHMYALHVWTKLLWTGLLILIWEISDYIFQISLEFSNFWLKMAIVDVDLLVGSIQL